MYSERGRGSEGECGTYVAVLTEDGLNLFILFYSLSSVAPYSSHKTQRNHQTEQKRFLWLGAVRSCCVFAL